MPSRLSEVHDLPISADTPRAAVAKEVTAAGADAINDVTGLKYDSEMADTQQKLVCYDNRRIQQSVCNGQDIVLWTH